MSPPALNDRPPPVTYAGIAPAACGSRLPAAAADRLVADPPAERRRSPPPNVPKFQLYAARLTPHSTGVVASLPPSRNCQTVTPPGDVGESLSISPPARTVNLP